MQLRIFLCIMSLAICFGAHQLSAQITKGNEKVPFGILDAALADQLIQTIEGVGGSSLETLKEQNLKPYLMPVRRVESPQAEKAYLLAAALEYYVNLYKNYKINLSPEYVLLNVGQKPEGMLWETALKFLSEEGTINAAVIPYGATSLTSAVYATPRFRVQNFVYLFRTVTKPAQRIFDIRKTIMRGNPVLIDIQLDASFRQANYMRSWSPQSLDQTATFPLMIVGYDETRQAFEVMSPWGSEWGRGGYLWLSYDLVSKQALNGYVLIPE